MPIQLRRQAVHCCGRIVVLVEPYSCVQCTLIDLVHCTLYIVGAGRVPREKLLTCEAYCTVRPPIFAAYGYSTVRLYRSFWIQEGWDPAMDSSHRPRSAPRSSADEICNQPGSSACPSQAQERNPVSSDTPCMPAFLLIAGPLTEIHCSQSSDLHAASRQPAGQPARKRPVSFWHAFGHALLPGRLEISAAELRAADRGR
jgi:hypothetical protein